MRELMLKWDGTEYRCRISHDVVMHIENKLTIQSLGRRLAEGGAAGDVPTSHVAWLLFCVLRAAGAPVTSEMVWETVRGNELDPETLTTVLSFVFEETYGVGPEEALEDSTEGKPAAE